VKWANGDDITAPVFKAVTIAGEDAMAVTFSSELGDDCQFVGKYSPFIIDADNIDQIIMMGANSTLGYSKNPRSLRSCRAHFVAPISSASGAAVKSYNISFGEEDEATGIMDIEADVQDTVMEGEGIYDLQGRKVTNPVKGIYIVNGKKVMY